MEIKTYNEIYLDARRKLKAAGVENFNLEARLMISAASQKSKEEFLRDLKLYALGDVEQRVNDMIARRCAGEPVAYVLGEWEFMGLPFKVDEGVLIPRADTEVMAELAIKLLQARGGSGVRVLDLCCGTGCIGISIAANIVDCRVVLVDNSMRALRTARANVLRNKTSRNTTCIEADAMENPPMLLGRFDLIVCNPPYIESAEIDTLDSSVKDYEPREALDGGEDGLDFYRAIIQKWTSILKENGCMMFECGEGQAETICGLMRAEGFKNVAAHRDTRGVLRVVAGIK
ncbi:MAG: peptide chain release factor N(5)-glutamine methyltransferase [Oscillospiraceae bacterium]